MRVSAILPPPSAAADLTVLAMALRSSPWHVTDMTPTAPRAAAETTKPGKR